MAVDNHGGLENFPFSYYEGGEKVFICYNRRQVMIQKGQKAKSFLARMTGCDRAAQQIVMAKITGNFKRGNERQGGTKSDKPDLA
jgi:hypothetical protein